MTIQTTTARAAGVDGTDPMAAFALDTHRYPVDEWALREVSYTVTDLGKTETLFSVGNGYLGMRGNVEEGRDVFSHGTYINGFHETWPIRHAEEAFGFARVGQTIVNVPDAKVLRLYVDDEPLLLSVADLESYERTLHFADGVLYRDLIWRTPAGKRVRIRSRRMVSFTERHLAVITYEVTMLDGNAPVVISSQVLNRQGGDDEYSLRSLRNNGSPDPRRGEVPDLDQLEPVFQWRDQARYVLGYQCPNSRMTLACGVDHVIDTDLDVEESHQLEPGFAKHIFRMDATKGSTITITKMVSYHTSRGVPAKELGDRCRRTLDRARVEGADKQFADQRVWLAAFWARSDVEVFGQPAVQQAVRWNLFQLAQAAARADGNGIPAKGLTGSGYNGHYFWDAEIYALPFLTYTSPEIARNALRFRYLLLPAARRRAADLTQVGALYPWRTINGEEASAYYAAGTAQYHIDADICYALCQYVAATGDEQFLAREAIDVLVETARMWADLGFWRVNGDEAFHIHGVTGPDEYTTVVNDNLYTNVMARRNLRSAIWAVHLVKTKYPDAYLRMVDRLGLTDDELSEWTRAADFMHIPYDELLGIHPQDAQFLEKEIWDLANTPASKRPLLLHYHPLVIYRFQVLKQADVVLALFLQGNEFSMEQKLADFDYYDPLTTGDSTLSAVVQSIIAAEVGYQELAVKYFANALYVDLADVHANTCDGVHVASAGGVWNAIVNGFGGLRDHDGQLSLDPRLPELWEGIAFRLTVRGTRMRVELRQEDVTLTIEAGDAVTMRVRDVVVTPSVGKPVRVPLSDQGPRLIGAPSARDITGSRRADGTVITASVPHHSGVNQ